MKIQKFQEHIGYNFKDKTVLFESITHSSYANENQSQMITFNERLEFLGDSVLGVVISEYLFKNFPKMPEGRLTKIRAKIVCEPSLAQVAKKVKLGEVLRLGRGEELTGGRERSSILADGLEALMAAIYLDGGYDCVKKFIFKFMGNIIDDSINGKILLDYKTRLQEVIQGSMKQELVYEIYDEKGPDHNKVFYVRVRLNNKVMGKGDGGNKKEAEQLAAKRALERLANEKK